MLWGEEKKKKRSIQYRLDDNRGGGEKKRQKIECGIKDNRTTMGVDKKV